MWRTDNDGSLQQNGIYLENFRDNLLSQKKKKTFRGKEFIDKFVLKQHDPASCRVSVIMQEKSKGHNLLDQPLF